MYLFYIFPKLLRYLLKYNNFMQLLEQGYQVCDTKLFKKKTFIGKFNNLVSSGTCLTASLAKKSVFCIKTKICHHDFDHHLTQRISPVNDNVGLLMLIYNNKSHSY